MQDIEERIKDIKRKFIITTIDKADNYFVKFFKSFYINFY